MPKAYMGAKNVVQLLAGVLQEKIISKKMRERDLILDDRKHAFFRKIEEEE